MITNPKGIPVTVGMRIEDYDGAGGSLGTEGVVVAIARNGVCYRIDAGDIKPRQIGDLAIADWSTLAICPDRTPPAADASAAPPEPEPDPELTAVNQLADDWFQVLDDDPIENLLLEIRERLPYPIPMTAIVMAMLTSWEQQDVETQGGMIAEAMGITPDRLRQRTRRRKQR